MHWLVAANELAEHLSQMVLALMGIGGTLLGVWLTSRGNRRILEIQQEHEDRTRFHQHRLETYIEFHAASAELIMIRAPVDESETDRLLDVNVRVKRALERVILLGSREVAGLAKDVLSMAGVLISGTADVMGDVQSRDARNNYQKRLDELRVAMRNDLGVESRM
jgi:hypothetical protein